MSKISIVNSDGNLSKDSVSPSNTSNHTNTSVPKEVESLDNEIIETNDQKDAVSVE